MKRLKWLVVFLVISFPSFAQQFLLVEDTVRINAKVTFQTSDCRIKFALPREIESCIVEIIKDSDTFSNQTVKDIAHIGFQPLLGVLLKNGAA